MKISSHTINTTVARIAARPLNPDPPVRRNKLCANTPCKKPLPKWPEGGYASPADFKSEPFCSTECARAWHSNPLPPPS